MSRRVGPFQHRSFTKSQAVNWLASHGLGTSGTKSQLISKVKLYQRYPTLVSNLRKRKCNNYSFRCSLEIQSVPPLTAPWKADEVLLPPITEVMFQNYASQKTEGSIGQQEKAVRIIVSRICLEANSKKR